MIHVRLFAQLREFAGSSRLEVDDAAAPDVGSLVDHLTSRFGAEFGRVSDAGTVIVDGQTVGRERKLVSGDEVALLPPVSGGAAPKGPPRNARAAQAVRHKEGRLWT